MEQLGDIVLRDFPLKKAGVIHGRRRRAGLGKVLELY